MESFAWIAVRHASGKWGLSRTASFELPLKVCQLIRAGAELGEAIDKVYMHKDSKKKEGAVGELTHGLINREAYYRHGIVLALVLFMELGIHGIDKAVKPTDSKQLFEFPLVTLISSTTGERYVLPGVGEGLHFTIPTESWRVEDLVGRELYLLEPSATPGTFQLSRTPPPENEIARSSSPVCGVVGDGEVRTYGSLSEVANDMGQVHVVFGPTTLREEPDGTGCAEVDDIETVSSDKDSFY